MKDRELLELAAKAAGVLAERTPLGFYLQEDCRMWNPLTDDGDALRLAVALKIQITPQTYRDCEVTAYRSGFCEANEKSTTGYGIEKATRRAIVRAAAEIGKAMP